MGSPNSKMRILAAMLACWLLAVPWGPARADTLYVRAGRLIDVVAGRVLADRMVRIEGDRIASVKPYAGEPPAGAKFVDWSGYTVLPGLMDMHAHLVGDITSNDVLAPLKSTEARDVLQGAANARATLMAGFTTVRDVGTYRGLADVALRDAITAGWIDGPRMFVAGAYITIPGGGGEVTGDSAVNIPPEFRRGVARGPDEVRARVRELVRGGADLIKMIATGAVLTVGTTPSEPEFTEAEIRAAVEEARKHGRFVAAHAHGAEGIHRAVRAGVRSIEHASYLDDEGIRLMVQHKTWLVADIYNGDYIDEVGRRDHWPEEYLRKNRETTDIQRAAFTKAVRAGVSIAYGTDSGVYPHGQNARQFAYMVRYGMTPVQAIQSATINAARLLGKERELGSITRGKFADLIAVDGDPIANIDVLRRVVGVIKAGKAYTALPRGEGG
jgi:imidazolonepropionase-like amidohydrolase